MTENALTSATAGDDAAASSADQIPVTASEAKAVETAETINAANEAAENSTGDSAKVDAEPAKEPEKKVQRAPAWAEKKIEEEAFRRREEARQRKAAEERAARLEAELEAVKRGNPPQNDNASQQPPNAPQGGIDRRDFASKDDFDNAVRQEAERVARIAEFNRQCNTVFEQGKTASADFPEAVQNLQRLGVMTPDNLDLVLAFGDDAHRLLFDLGSNPEEADKVFKLPPARLAAELGKKAAAFGAAKQPAPVSKAPPPVKPIEGAARVSAEPLDTDNDDEYFRKRIAQRREARAR